MSRPARYGGDNEEVKDLNPKYLDQAVVQLSVRIPLRLRARLDDYLDFMRAPKNRRPDFTHDWPYTLQKTVNTAIEEFLSTHPRKLKAGSPVKLKLKEKEPPVRPIPTVIKQPKGVKITPKMKPEKKKEQT